MANSSQAGASSKVSRVIKAPRAAVYRAFLDKDSVATWLAPNNMTGHVHTFDPREGGKFRMSLTYIDPKKSPGGKTTENTDTFQGRFVKLVPNETIVEAIEFESQEQGYAGEMTMTVSLKDVNGGTEVTVLFENLPKGVRPEDNDMGTRESLQKLAALLE